MKYETLESSDERLVIREVPSNIMFCILSVFIFPILCYLGFGSKDTFYFLRKEQQFVVHKDFYCCKESKKDKSRFEYDLNTVERAGMEQKITTGQNNRREYVYRVVIYFNNGVVIPLTSSYDNMNMPSKGQTVEQINRWLRQYTAYMSDFRGQEYGQYQPEPTAYAPPANEYVQQQGHMYNPPPESYQNPYGPPPHASFEASSAYHSKTTEEAAPPPSYSEAVAPSAPSAPPPPTS